MDVRYNRKSIVLNEDELIKLAKGCFEPKVDDTKAFGEFLEAYYKIQIERKFKTELKLKKKQSGNSKFYFHDRNTKHAYYKTDDATIYAFFGYFVVLESKNKFSNRIVWFINRMDNTEPIASVLTKDKDKNNVNFYVNLNGYESLAPNDKEFDSYFKAMKIRSGVVEDGIHRDVQIKHLLSVGAIKKNSNQLEYGEKTLYPRKTDNVITFQQDRNRAIQLEKNMHTQHFKISW